MVISQDPWYLRQSLGIHFSLGILPFTLETLTLSTNVFIVIFKVKTLFAVTDFLSLNSSSIFFFLSLSYFLLCLMNDWLWFWHQIHTELHFILLILFSKASSVFVLLFTFFLNTFYHSHFNCFQVTLPLFISFPTIMLSFIFG